MPDVPGQMPPGSPPTPPGGAPGTPPAAGPSGSPMMTPQKAAGQQASAKAKVMVAQKILQGAISELDLNGEFGKGVMELMAKFIKLTGKNEEDSQQLVPAELMQALQPAAGPGAAPGGAPPPGGAKPPQPAMPMQ